MSLTGTVVGGRYEIRDEIGRGGFGTVYRAFQANVNRDVAVKVLNEDASRSEKVVQRFEVEAKIISKLEHPNTLGLIDYGRTDAGALYVVTPLLHGSTLEDEVDRLGTPQVLSDNDISAPATITLRHRVELIRGA